jgi:hypothetical protein
MRGRLNLEVEPPPFEDWVEDCSEDGEEGIWDLRDIEEHEPSRNGRPKLY